MTTLESPIAGLSFRFRELGRLRMGQKVPARNGRTRPEKLETFRLTSTDPHLIKRASDLYGGKPGWWDDAPGWNADKQTGVRQAQVVVEAAAIPVKVPGELSWSQAMEAWTAAKCIRRCNGDAMDTGEPCKCREEMDEGRPAICKPYSRVNLILPELPGWGFWRLETHGWEAAREFIPMVVMAARFGPDETYRLRIDPRSKKGEDEQGRPVTYQFGVPVLDTDRTPAELFSRQADQLAIESPDQPSGPAAATPRGATGPDTTSSPPDEPASAPAPSARPGAGGEDPTSEVEASTAPSSRGGAGNRHASASDLTSPAPNPPSTAAAGAGGPTPASTTPEAGKPGRGDRRTRTGKPGDTDAPAGTDQPRLGSGPP
jgi:hypothetical protein